MVLIHAVSMFKTLICQLLQALCQIGWQFELAGRIRLPVQKMCSKRQLFLAADPPDYCSRIVSVLLLIVTMPGMLNAWNLNWENASDEHYDLMELCRLACSHDTERTFSVPEIWTEWSHCISTASGTLTGFNLHMHAFPLQCLLSVFSLSAGSLSACFFWPARFLNVWNSNCLKVELPF